MILNKFSSFCAIIAACLVSSCATQSPYTVVTGVSGSRKVVSLTPFQTNQGFSAGNPFITPPSSNELNGMTPEERAFREFEHLYLQAEITSTFNQSNLFEGAYTTPNSNCASDYTLNSHLSVWDGKNLSFYSEIVRVDGVKIGNVGKTWVVPANLQANPAGYIQQIFAEHAQRIVAKLKEDKVDLDYLRAQTYARQKLPYTKRILDIAKEAALVERESVLKPTTAKMESAALKIRPAYLSWQISAIPFVTMREQARDQMNMVQIQAAFSGMMAAQQLPVTDRAGRTGAMAGEFIKALPEIYVLKHQIESIQSILSNQKAVMNLNGFGTIKVILFNKLHTLQGTMAEQLEQLRLVVREELLKAVAEIPQPQQKA